MIILSLREPFKGPDKSVTMTCGMRGGLSSFEGDCGVFRSYLGACI